MRVQIGKIRVFRPGESVQANICAAHYRHAKDFYAMSYHKCKYERKTASYAVSLAYLSGDASTRYRRWRT